MSLPEAGSTATLKEPREDGLGARCQMYDLSSTTELRVDTAHAPARGTGSDFMGLSASRGFSVPETGLQTRD